MPLSLLLTLKLWEVTPGTREAATEEALEKMIVKNPTALQIREAEKRASREGMQATRECAKQ